MALPRPTHSPSPWSKIMALLTIIVGICVTALNFALVGEVLQYNLLMYVSAFLGICLTCVSLFAFRHSTPTFIIYFSLCSILFFSFVLNGGAKIILRNRVARELEESLQAMAESGEISILGNEEEMQKVASAESLRLLVTGIADSAAAASVALSMRYFSKVIGAKRTASSGIQAFNISFIPLSILIVAGGNFVMSSGTFATEPITGIFFLACGVLFFLVNFLGCFGSTTESLLFLSLYSWLSFSLGCVFLAGGITSLALADQFKDSVYKNWENIRLLLPPTFEGRYDKQSFGIFVESNITILGFVAIVLGVALYTQVFASITLRSELAEAKAQDKRDHKFADQLAKRRQDCFEILQSTRKPRPTLSSVLVELNFSIAVFVIYCPRQYPMTANPNESQVIGSHHIALVIRSEWNEKWKRKSRKQRMIVKVGCLVFSLILGALIAMLLTAVIFATSCDSISKYNEVYSVTINESPDQYQVREISVHQGYRTGILAVTVGDDTLGKIDVAEMALSDDYGGKVPLLYRNGSKMTYELEAKEADVFAGIDMSCQESIMHVSLPAPPANGSLPSKTGSEEDDEIYSPVLELSSYDLLDVDLTDKKGFSALVHSTKLETVAGNIHLHGAYIGGGGGTLTSRTGSIKVTDSRLDAKASVQSLSSNDTENSGSGNTQEEFLTSLLEVESPFGLMTLDNVTLRDTVLVARARTGQALLEDVTSISDEGVSTIHVSSEKGSVVMKTVAATSTSVSTTSGLVVIDDLFGQQGQKATLSELLVSTTYGDVMLTNIHIEGYIQLYSWHGNIKIQIKDTAFVGLYNIRSEYGEVIVRKGKSSYDKIYEDEKSKERTKQGTVNCDQEKTGECYYVGDINIATVTGNIEVVFGCDADAPTQCK